MVEHADEQTGTTALIVATHTDTLESGFYLLSGSSSFDIKRTTPIFHCSKSTSMTNEPQNIALDVTNSFVSTTSAPGGVAAPKILPRDFLYCSRSLVLKKCVSSDAL
jgi:hypothetical protein